MSIRARATAGLLVGALAVGGLAPAAHAQHTGPYGSSPETFRLVAAQQEYDANRKDPWAAFALELVVPGLGNAYVGEREEALLEWFGLLTGLLLVLDGRGVTCGRLVIAASCATSEAKTIVGVALMTGSWLFGVTTAPMNAVRHNDALRARLGLDGSPTQWSMAPTLMAVPAGAGAGLNMTF